MTDPVVTEQELTDLLALRMYLLDAFYGSPLCGLLLAEDILEPFIDALRIPHYRFNIVNEQIDRTILSFPHVALFRLYTQQALAVMQLIVTHHAPQLREKMLEYKAKVAQAHEKPRMKYRHPAAATAVTSNGAVAASQSLDTYLRL